MYMLINDQMPDLSRYQKPEQQIDALYQYVYNLRQQINHVLSNLDSENLGADLKTTIDQIQQAVTDAVQSGQQAETEETPQEKPTYTAEDIGLGNVANERQYSEENPPPYPVTSVNDKTGAVVLNANDVGAAPSGYGLGGSSVEIDDWNTAIQNGFYRSSASCINSPVAGSQYHGMMINFSQTLGNQIVFKTWTTGAEIWTRRFYNGTFEPWERVNPPVVKTYTVTVNSSFVSSGTIIAQSINGVLMVSGYFGLKTTHSASTTHTICTISGVKVNWNAYTSVSDHDGAGKAYDILLLTENNATRVQMESHAYSLSSGRWVNFTLFALVGE